MHADDREPTGWEQSRRLLGRFLGGGCRLDHLLQDSSLESEEAARCRFYLTGTIRNLMLLETILDRQIPRRPRPEVRSILLLGAFEILENPDQTPKIVHFAVEQAKRRVSKPESGLINSVLRRFPEALAKWKAGAGKDAASLAILYSHPAWMVRRWLAAFGSENTRRLLEWNQQAAGVYARRIDLGTGAAASLPGAVESPWPDFVEISGMSWSDVSAALRAGTIYIQDPATRLAPKLLGVGADEAVLDLCASPGGKTLQLAQAAARTGGRVVAIDLPGPRMIRLRENTRRHADWPISLLGADVRDLNADLLRSHGLPAIYDGVLIDVPCSNTGVLRHRVDAKWRLKEADLDNLTRLQSHLLEAASRLVRPGGSLVYSTCSLEREENDGVVETFVAAHPGFERGEGGVALPWESGHDGAGSFLLRRKP
ncbi:MAG: transcription antitermination factor NusB [Opitutaceae bacterium]